MTPPENDRLLRMAEVEQRIGLSGSTIYLKIAAGTFPKPIKISVQAVRWRESEVNQWVADRAAEMQKPDPAAPAEQTPKPPRKAKRTGSDRKHDHRPIRPASRGSFCVQNSITPHSHF